MKSEKQFVNTLEDTLGGEELWTDFSVVLPKLRFSTKSLIVSGYITSQTSVPRPTTRIRILLNGVRELDLAMGFPIFERQQDEKPLDQSEEVLMRNRQER